MHTTNNGQFATTSASYETIIKPHRMQEICLGIYESCIPRPTFTITSKPDVGNLLATTLHQKNNFGDYTLTYVIKNESDTICHVRVTEDELHGSERVV